jgi:3-oxoacyl-ACP reductase-like protein
LEKFLKFSFMELREAAGARPPQEKKKSTQPKTPAVSKAAPAQTTVRVSIPLLGPRPLAKPARAPDPRVKPEKILSQMIA